MYNEIMRGLRWFGELFTLNILAIVAIAVVGVVFLTWLIWMMFVKPRTKCCVRKRHQAEAIRRFSLMLGWLYFGVALVAFIFMFAGAILTSAIMHLAFPIAVVAAVYLLCFLFQLFCGGCKCACNTVCNDCIVPVEKASKKSPKEEPKREKDECVVEKAKVAAKEKKAKEEIKEEKTPQKKEEKTKAVTARLIETSTTPKHIQDEREAAAEVEKHEPKPVKQKEEAKPAPKAKPAKKEEKAKPAKVVSKPEKKKPEPKKAKAKSEVVEVEQEPIVWTPSNEPKVETHTQTTVTATRNVSSTLSSSLGTTEVRAGATMTTVNDKVVEANSYITRHKTTNELKAEHKSLSVEKEAMQKKLDEMRVQKIQSIGTPNAGGGSARLGYYSDANSFSKTGSGYLQKVDGSKYEESEVRTALQNLKATMDDIQRQIDARTEH